MTMTAQELLLTSAKIASFGTGDCYSTHIYEVWQHLKTNAYYQLEIYYAGDDDGFKKVTELSEAEADEIIQQDEFYKGNGITGNLKKFIQDNWNTCKSYAEEFFAGDICQAGEYLFDQI